MSEQSRPEGFGTDSADVEPIAVSLPISLPTPVYTKESLTARLREIKAMGEIHNPAPGNAGSVGDLLEALLGIRTNNLPLPNAGEWELKSQRIGTASLVTLFHLDPSPIGMSLVQNLLLPYYGWQHKQAGLKYPESELSFRQTISGDTFTDRGFRIVIDSEQQRVVLSFNSSRVSARHTEWLRSVEARVGHLGELTPQPYWNILDLERKAGLKLHNSFFVQAQRRRSGGEEFLYYERCMMLRDFDVSRLVAAIATGKIKVDFDARTGHNHGTKFRLRQSDIPDMYAHVDILE